MTGMRRGEALALRWADFDLDAGTVSVRRSVTMVKTKGAGEQLITGAPKSGKARVIDLDPQTPSALRSHRARLAGLMLALGRDDALVLGTIQGEVRHPERFSRTFQYRVAAARKKLGTDLLPSPPGAGSAAYPRDPATPGRGAPEDHQRAARPRQGQHHPRRVLARRPDAATQGGRQASRSRLRRQGMNALLHWRDWPDLRDWVAALGHDCGSDLRGLVDAIRVAQAGAALSRSNPC